MSAVASTEHLPTSPVGCLQHSDRCHCNSQYLSQPAACLQQQKCQSAKGKFPIGYSSALTCVLVGQEEELGRRSSGVTEVCAWFRKKMKGEIYAGSVAICAGRGRLRGRFMLRGRICAGRGYMRLRISAERRNMEGDLCCEGG